MGRVSVTRDDRTVSAADAVKNGNASAVPRTRGSVDETARLFFRLNYAGPMR